MGMFVFGGSSAARSVAWAAAPKRLMELSLVHGPLPRVVFGVTAVAFAVLVVGMIVDRAVRSGAERRESAGAGVWPVLRAPACCLLVAVAVGAVALLGTWLVSDVFLVFGVSLGWTVIGAIACGAGAVGFLVAGLVALRRRRFPRTASRRALRALTVVLIPLTLMSAGLRVDSIIGEFQTLGSLVGYSPYAAFDTVKLARPAMSVAQWRADASRPKTPSHGRILIASIPNTRSGFVARRAMVYLPPAALTDTPPALPVMELLAGQPGSPGRLMSAGNIAATMNAYAADHDGLAPIVVTPDQNGSDMHNSLCADTSKGNAETYLTRDVVDWAKSHLPVATTPRMWAIGGFSQGGTCTTQLGPRHPELYGAMLPVDGELKPTSGSVASMTRKYFRGDRAAYDAQVPVNAIAATGTPDQALFTGAGENDTESVGNMRTIADAARKAGMEVTELIVPGTGHDWHAVQAVWKPGLDWFGARTGLGAMTTPIKDYPNVEVQE